MTTHPPAAAPIRPPHHSDQPSLRSAADAKIQPRHLTRTALIYVRQSHPSQVQRHPESARRQYGLVERAQTWGWAADQITVIDDDQGKSAAGSAAAHERDGFARLVVAVGLGEVGIILALEVSRLARNSAEWYRLLELAALAGVLIADDSAVYDPRLFDDRLLLGLRGTVSEVELHCIQERLQGARHSNAQRGELHLRSPAGYVHGSDGRVDLDPDQAVQAALRTIFEQFARLGTASAVLRFCNAHALTLPRRRWTAQTPRRVDRHGYVRFRHWRVYGERGLARQTVAVWLTDTRLVVAYSDEPLVQYAVTYARDRYQLTTVTEERRFVTPFQSPQPPLWEPAAGEWLRVLQVPAPVRRLRRRVVSEQPWLFALAE